MAYELIYFAKEDDDWYYAKYDEEPNNNDFVIVSHFREKYKKYYRIHDAIPYTSRIEILDDGRIIFYKRLWGVEEIELAVCLGLESSVDEKVLLKSNTGSLSKLTFICDPRKICKESAFYFMMKTFHAVLKDKVWQDQVKEFYGNVKVIYDEQYNYFHHHYQNRIPFWDKLYMHQRHDGIYRSMFRKHNLLSFEQGLGKSITAIGISMAKKSTCTLIIVPAILKWKWYEEMTDKKSIWGLNPIEFTVLDAKKNRPGLKEKYIVINYDIISKQKFMDYILSRKPDHVVIDECHYIKNPKTLRCKSVQKIVAELNPKITLLSGTPIKNRVDDLFSYLKLTGHYLGSNHARFMRMYTVQSGKGIMAKVTGAKDHDDLRQKISNFLVRKTKKECLDLPDKIFQKMYFDLDDYEEDYGNEVLSMTQDNQPKDRMTIEGNIHSLNIIAAMSKINPTIKFIEDLVYQGEKVVVFTGYKKPIALLAEHFKDTCVRVDGSVTDSETKFALAKQFQNDESIRVFLGNYQSAGAGIDLFASSNVVFLNMPLTPDLISQPMDRCHRIGQKNTVNVYFMLSRDTIDEDLYDTIASKVEDINEIVDHGKDPVDLGTVRKEMFKNAIKRFAQRKNIQTLQNYDVVIKQKSAGSGKKGRKEVVFEETKNTTEGENQHRLEL